ncbi:hypothetical protein ACFFRR_005166 [Megaselia abdita]
MNKTIISLVVLFIAAALADVITYEAPPLSYAHSSVGTTQHNVVRSFDGTVSQYSKAVDTPFSSVRKVDTRINNNVYSPTGSIAYSSPLIGSAHLTPISKLTSSGVAVSPIANSISYSPAVEVAHVSFDGFGTHYAF